MEIITTMLKRILPILLASAVLLTACGGGEVTPAPISAVDIQNTAIAAAQTIVAATSMAQPPTPLPPPTEVPSPTPLPTFTADPLLMPPTVGFPTMPPTPTQASGSENCNKPLSVGEAGGLKNLRVENNSGGNANLSLNLWTPNLFGQCGALSYQVKKGAKIRIQIPAGSWYAYAWIEYGKGKNSTAEGSFYLGPSKSTDLLRLIIKQDVIGIIGP